MLGSTATISMETSTMPSSTISPWWDGEMVVYQCHLTPKDDYDWSNVLNLYEGDCGPAENNRCLEFRSWAIPGWAKKMPSQMKSLNFSDIPHLFAIFLLILFFSSKSRSLQPKWDELYSYLSSPTGFQVCRFDTISIWYNSKHVQ